MKRKDHFIEADMTEDVNVVRDKVKASVPVMKKTIPHEDTRSGVKIHFVSVIWSEVWEALRIENPKE